MSRFKKFIYYYLPPLIWMGVIFFFSTRQRISVSREYMLNFIFFKTLHIIEYFILDFLILRAVFKLKSISLNFKERIILSFLISILYAFSDEFHQIFIPTRNGIIRDVFIDSIGMLLSIHVFVKIRILPKFQKFL